MLNGSPDMSSERWRENVAAVVMDAGGNILLGRTSGKSPYWHFPQGGVREGELLEEAVRRELWEEVRLPAEGCLLLARYGGVRYRYRDKNRKSERWKGQQQTYFLFLCPGRHLPETDCSGSDEFSSVIWLPWQELRAELFPTFKREAVEAVLRAFFPAAAQALQVGRVPSLTPERYRTEAGKEVDLSCLAVDDRALFGGGKEEARSQMEDAGRRIYRAQRQLGDSLRLLLLLHGLPGSGRHHTLRALARCMDPLATRAVPPRCSGTEPHPLWPLHESVPYPGEAVLISRTPYVQWEERLRSADSGGEEADFPVEALRRMEADLQQQGILLLKVYLHLPLEKYEPSDASLPQAGQEREWHRRTLACQRMIQETASVAPWYVVPAQKRWYADLVLASLVAERLEALSASMRR